MNYQLSRTERLAHARTSWRRAWDVSLVWLPPFTQRTAVVLLGVLATTLALLGGLAVLPDRLDKGSQLGTATGPTQAEGSAATTTPTTTAPQVSPPAPRGQASAGASARVEPAALVGTGSAAAEPQANPQAGTQAGTQAGAQPAGPPTGTTAPPASASTPTTAQRLRLLLLRRRASVPAATVTTAPPSEQSEPLDPDLVDPLLP